MSAMGEGGGKACEMCQACERVPGFRYCAVCTKTATRAMERSGYLRPVPPDPPAARRPPFGYTPMTIVSNG